MKLWISGKKMLGLGPMALACWLGLTGSGWPGPSRLWLALAAPFALAGLLRLAGTRLSALLGTLACTGLALTGTAVRKYLFTLVSVVNGATGMQKSGPGIGGKQIGLEVLFRSSPM